jgi:exonuclease III
MLNGLKDAHKCPIVWAGDINVAPYPIDVSDPKKMKTWSGFLPEERASIKRFMTGTISVQNDAKEKQKQKQKSTTWIDVWRHHNPNKVTYTWQGDRKTNVMQDLFGLRLDAIIIDSESINRIISVNVDKTFNHDNLSDHHLVGCSVSI